MANVVGVKWSSNDQKFATSMYRRYADKLNFIDNDMPAALSLPGEVGCEGLRELRHARRAALRAARMGAVPRPPLRRARRAAPAHLRRPVPGPRRARGRRLGEHGRGPARASGHGGSRPADGTRVPGAAAALGRLDPAHPGRLSTRPASTSGSTGARRSGRTPARRAGPSRRPPAREASPRRPRVKDATTLPGPRSDRSRCGAAVDSSRGDEVVHQQFTGPRSDARGRHHGEVVNEPFAAQRCRADRCGPDRRRSRPYQES